MDGLPDDGRCLSGEQSDLGTLGRRIEHEDARFEAIGTAELHAAAASLFVEGAAIDHLLRAVQMRHEQPIAARRHPRRRHAARRRLRSRHRLSRNQDAAEQIQGRCHRVPDG